MSPKYCYLMTQGKFTSPEHNIGDWENPTLLIAIEMPEYNSLFSDWTSIMTYLSLFPLNSEVFTYVVYVNWFYKDKLIYFLSFKLMYCACMLLMRVNSPKMKSSILRIFDYISIWKFKQMDHYKCIYIHYIIKLHQFDYSISEESSSSAKIDFTRSFAA